MKKMKKNEHIDDLIDAWHRSDSKIPLHEYLGMTRKEYAEWVEARDIEEDQ